MSGSSEVRTWRWPAFLGSYKGNWARLGGVLLMLFCELCKAWSASWVCLVYVPARGPAEAAVFWGVPVGPALVDPS
jgi:hypothetical protein